MGTKNNMVIVLAVLKNVSVEWNITVASLQFQKTLEG